MITLLLIIWVMVTCFVILNASIWKENHRKILEVAIQMEKKKNQLQKKLDTMEMNNDPRSN